MIRFKFVKTFLIVIFMAALAGCDMVDSIKAQISKFVPSGSAMVSFSWVGAKATGKFTKDVTTVSIQCLYTIKGTLEGVPYTKVFNVTITINGTEGGDYELKCDDPVFLQVPADVTHVAGTYSNGTLQGPVIVKSDFQTLQTSMNTSLAAEPGQKFVLLSLPDGLPIGTYSTQFTFDLSSSRVVNMKMLLVGEVHCGFLTYYPILAPSAVSLSTVPVEVFPLADTQANVSIPLDLQTTANPTLTCPVIYHVNLPVILK